MKNTASYVTARHKRAKLSSSVSLQIMSLPPLVANILEKSIYHFCPGKTLASAASRFYLQILASLTSILPEDKSLMKITKSDQSYLDEPTKCLLDEDIALDFLLLHLLVIQS